MQHIPLIEKERIQNLNFLKTDVLNNQVLRNNRYHSLCQALILGNSYQCKVKIIFQTSDTSLQQVETTIWAISEDFIFLKGGVFIPVKAILTLEI